MKFLRLGKKLMSKTTDKRQKVWSEQDLEYLRNNAGKLPEKDIADFLGRTESSICRQINKLKLTKIKKKKGKDWTAEELTFLKENIDKMSTEEMSNILGRPIGGIQTKRWQIGIKKEIKFYDPVPDFQKPSKELAWTLGFTFADGCLYQHASKRPGRLIVGVKYTDNCYLKNVLYKVSPVWKYRQYQYKTNDNPVSEYVINSSKLFSFLYHDLEFKHKNEFFSHKIFDFLPQELHRYFWRGFLDGDGSVNMMDKNGNLSFGCHFSGPHQMNWGKLSELLDSIKSSHSHRQYDNMNSSNRIRGHWSNITLNGHDAVRFLNHIYKDFPKDNIGFTRKFIRYVRYLERRAISPYYSRMKKNSELLGV
jgi:hypothetical protein